MTLKSVLLVLSRVVAVVALASACDRNVASPVPLYPAAIKNHVTADVAATLTSDGHFTLPQPPPDPFPRIAPERAVEIAVAFAKTFAPYLRDYLERGHGRAIRFETLRAGSPAYYAATPYEAPAGDVDPGLRNAFGPYYLVYLTSPDGTPVLMVSVAAYTQAWVENGRLRLPAEHGMEVDAEGVPVGQGFTMPPSPERAVEMVGAASGARASAVPELWLPDRDYSAAHARWKVPLDRSAIVRLKTRSERYEVREIYVGLRGELFVAAPGQPAARNAYNAHGRQWIQVAVRPGRPVAFEAVTLSSR